MTHRSQNHKNDTFFHAQLSTSITAEMSLRQIELKTGISYSTVKGLLEGRQPNAETLIRFANAYHVAVPDALRLAGYVDIADVWERGAYQHPADDVTPNFKAPKPDPTGLPDSSDQFLDAPEEDREVWSWYTGLPPEDKETIRKLKAMMEKIRKEPKEE